VISKKGLLADPGRAVSMARQGLSAGMDTIPAGAALAGPLPPILPAPPIACSAAAWRLSCPL